LSAFYPGLAPIEAYGNGGFRFAGMSHTGSLLVLPSGIAPWSPSEPLASGDFGRVFAEAAAIDFLLLGTGQALLPVAPAIRAAFAERGIGLEAMATGAAVRTYNVLLAERRRVGAALIAVENA
jgi:uncharacterized protein